MITSVESCALFALIEKLVSATLDGRRSAAAVVEAADRGARHGQAHLALVAAARVVLQLRGWRGKLRLHHDVRDACIAFDVRLVEALSIECLHEAHGHGGFEDAGAIKGRLRVDVRVLFYSTHALITEVQGSTRHRATSCL